MANTWRLPPELFYPAARFWEKADTTDKTGCWPWRHAVNLRNGGYAVGAFKLDGSRVTAPRMAWLIAHGPIPAGKFVLHRCDNPRCVRPAHLRLGTQAENMAEMVARGRSGRGERHSQAVITDAQVIELRRRRAAGESAATLAREFGLKPTTCLNILRGQSYRYLPMPEKPTPIPASSFPRSALNVPRGT